MGAAMKVTPLAGTLATTEMLVDVAALVSAYHDRIPDPSNPAQRVVFGTSGHRGSSLETTFNEGHVLAISQAICQYRAAHGIDGPLFLGLDTHALSLPAFAARPSGTEDIYKIYGESFRGEEHLRVLLGEAQRLVDRALGDAKA
jgi:phosphoglucomutase